MPRSRMSDWIITSSEVTIAPSGTYTLESVPGAGYLDLIDTFYPQVFYRAEWQATGNPTGLSVEIYRGYAVAASGDYLDPEDNVEFTDDSDSVTVNNQPTVSIGTPQTTRNDFGLNPELYPRRVKIVFTNLDTVNSCTLFVSGDR